jgi:hypothetical protein
MFRLFVVLIRMREVSSVSEQRLVAFQNGLREATRTLPSDRPSDAIGHDLSGRRVSSRALSVSPSDLRLEEQQMDPFVQGEFIAARPAGSVGVLFDTPKGPLAISVEIKRDRVQVMSYAITATLADGRSNTIAAGSRRRENRARRNRTSNRCQ